MTILDGSSLDFAKRHIETFYDSDFFPKADEYVVLWDKWDEVRTYLQSTNVGKLDVQEPRSMPAPKARGGYRIVHQLHPTDAIAYTALARTVAATIARKRPPESNESVFSYRIKPTQDSFFGSGNGYALYVERCKQLAAEHAFVFTTDIADFYNRIYTHRINNNIVCADQALKKVAADIENLLLQFNQKTSQGIPVGPAASIILSEALMLDIDERISTSGLKHCRYVDDVRIFSDDRAVLERLEEELAEYLYSIHRLQLAPGKTAILDSRTFLIALESPALLERRELLSAARPISDYGDAFTESDVEDLAKKFIDFEEAPESSRDTDPKTVWAKMLARLKAHDAMQRDLVRAEVIDSLFRLGTSGPHVDLGLTRHALRRARSWKVDKLVPLVLGSFERLGPVLPEVFLYLHDVMTLNLRIAHHAEIGALVTGRLFASSRFARHWIYWFVSSFEDQVAAHDAVLRRAPVEFQARGAAAGKKFAWLRSLKNISTYGLWDRRAVIFAWRVMPFDERKWLNSISAVNQVEAWLLDWVKSRP
jgi:Reverse transcriptase (RNA-dependent DNA polymerase)